MKVGKKLLSLVLVSLLVITVISGCSKSDSSSTTSKSVTSHPKKLQTLHLAVMTGMFTHYTALIGEKQGIYEKYGIDLDVTEYAAGINTIDALATGQADLGFAADFAVVNRIGNTLDSSNLDIISEVQGSTVNGGLYVDPKYADNLNALDGKGFIGSIGTVSEYYYSNLFKYLGFDESKQKLLNSDSPQTALALAQKGDAVAIFTSGANAKLYEKLGWKKAVDASELNLSTYSFNLTTKEFNKNNAKLIANYLKATQESYEYFVKHLDESAAYLEETLGVDASVVKADWSVAKSDIGFSEKGVTQLEEIEKWAVQNAKFDKEYNVRDYINTDAIKIAFPDKVTLADKK